MDINIKNIILRGEGLTAEPYLKNPHIAQIFMQMGCSEELGTGIKNVYKYSKAYSGSENIIFKEEDIFITQVPLNIFDSENVTENVTENERFHRIIELIKTNPYITSSQMSKRLNVVRRTIARDLEKLKKKNVIIRIGGDKGGYWKIIE